MKLESSSVRRAPLEPCRVIEHHMYYLWQILIGILAGWLAGKIMRGRGFGVVLDLILGVVGSLIGGLVFGVLGLHAYGLIGSIVVATTGAVMLLYLVRRL